MELEDDTKMKSKKIATDVCKALGIWDMIGKNQMPFSQIRLMDSKMGIKEQPPLVV